MKRKYVYGVLAVPIVLILLALVLAPGETRATFFTEFVHRTKLMMGYEPETYHDDELGPSEEDLEATELDVEVSDDETASSEGDTGAEDDAVTEEDAESSAADAETETDDTASPN